MSGYLRIGGAVLMGTILVLGAFVFTRYGTTKNVEAGAIVSVAPTRAYVEEADSDNDGTPDWEEALKERIIDSIKIPTSTTSAAVPYEKPTTFTGQFAESFLSDYLKSKQGGDPLEDKDALIDAALSAVESSITSKTYAISDFTVVNATDESIRNYGNAIAEIMLSKPSSGEQEVVITVNSLKANNPDELKKLDSAKQNYKSMAMEMLDVSVPATYADLHLNLINSYEAVYSDIDAMGQAFDDPLYALARFKQHYDDIQGMFVSIKDLQKRLLADGVVYEKNEPGAYLYVFKL